MLAAGAMEMAVALAVRLAVGSKAGHLAAVAALTAKDSLAVGSMGLGMAAAEVGGSRQGTPRTHRRRQHTQPRGQLWRS